MLSFLADGNFNNDILRGVERPHPEIPIQRVQDVFGVEATEDPDILELAAQENLIVLTHDIKTMIGFAYERVDEGKPMSGVLVVPQDEPVGRMIAELILVALCSTANDFENQVRYLPL